MAVAGVGAAGREAGGGVRRRRGKEGDGEERRGGTQKSRTQGVAKMENLYTR